MEQSDQTKRGQSYTPLSVRMALQLAAPHTWPAAILPVLFACALAATAMHVVSASLTGALLVICVLMQASVNTLNDYYDFMKGADSVENQSDPTDAVLVYNNVNPKAALRLAVGFLVVAFLLGAYVVFCAGWIPLAIGLVGAAIIVLYSAGSSPISYLPIGEYVSGITMGGLIPLASYQALTGLFDPIVLLLALPFMLGIALIMFTNNTCDIEKDIEAGRKTQSIMLGHEKAVKAYHAVIIIWIVSIAVFAAAFFTPGLIVVPFMLLAVYPNAKALWSNPLNAQTRAAAMPQCLNLNIALGTFYTAAILMSGTTLITF